MSSGPQITCFHLGSQGEDSVDHCSDNCSCSSTVIRRLCRINFYPHEQNWLISMYNRLLVSQQLLNFCLGFKSLRKSLLKTSFGKFQKEENNPCSIVRGCRCRSKCLNGINTSPVLQQRCQAGVIH